VRARDADAFAGAIRTLLRDPELRARMGADAVAHVRAHHDVSSAARQLDVIVRDALDRCRRADTTAVSC